MVLDASAVIALVAGEPAGPAVQRELGRRDQASIAAVNWAEVVDWMIRVGGYQEDVVRSRLDMLVSTGVLTIDSDEAAAALAGALRALYYHRTRAALSIADCFALELCLRKDAKLLSSDPAQLSVARRAGVEVVALPDSRGRLR